MIAQDIDLDLIRKYNRPGPRYTSYPTALEFTPEVDRAALLDDLRSGGGPLSLYFHLPFCESLCWFCGCTTVITTNQGKADRYLDLLEKELALHQGLIDPARLAGQLHFGGGTPNFLTPGQIDRLSEIIHGRFRFEEDAEMSVELAPAHLSEEQVQAFRRLGMTRASFGVQDVNPEVQKAIHRIQPHAVNLETVRWLREAGFTSVNIDLIYGLPLQTEESFERTIEAALEIDPDRLAVFSYAHVPWAKPAQKLLERAHLPEPETKLRILKMLIGKLTGAGYHHIGLDHFAKTDDELSVAQRTRTLQRNFQGYSTRAGVEIRAFGMSGISQGARSYHQNFKELDRYESALEAGELPIERGLLLSDDDLIRRDTIHRLMCDLSLDYATQSERLGIDFEGYFAGELASLEAMERDGLIRREPGRLTVEPMGRLLIRNIAMAFDAYLDASKTGFSKTV